MVGTGDPEEALAEGGWQGVLGFQIVQVALLQFIVGAVDICAEGNVLRSEGEVLCLDDIQPFGIVVGGNGNGQRRHAQEHQLLIDSVQSSRFITQKQAKTLTEKLKAKASRYDRVLLDRRCYVPNRVRSMNDSIFYHLDDLHTAIANDWQITFKYFYFTPKKQKAFYKKGELYTASPYALLWSDNNYYLLAFEGGKMKHFRVDKMDGISIVAQKREGKKEFKELNLSERSLRMFSMFSGKVQKVKIRFSNHLANVVIDRFGRDIVMVPDDEKHFTIHTDIEVSPQFFGWICGLGKAVRILAPAEVVEEMGTRDRRTRSRPPDAGPAGSAATRFQSRCPGGRGRRHRRPCGCTRPPEGC